LFYILKLRVIDHIGKYKDDDEKKSGDDESCISKFIEISVELLVKLSNLKENVGIFARSEQLCSFLVVLSFFFFFFILLFSRMCLVILIKK
jgi:hypothetical protein